MQITEQLVKKEFSLIPLKAKEPIVKWRKYQYKRATTEEILGWYIKFGDINLGIVTGRISNLAVIDVDDKKQMDKLKEIIPNIFDTYYVITKRGYHFYFSIDGRKISNTGKLFNLPGVGLSVDGRYVVAPGSKVNGHLYRQVGSLDKIKQLPEAITDKEQLRRDIICRGLIFRGKAKCISQILEYDIPEGRREIAYFVVFSKLLEAKNKAEYSRYLIKVANSKLSEPLPEKEIKAFSGKRIYHYGCAKINEWLSFIDCSNCEIRGGLRVKSLLMNSIHKLKDLTNAEGRILGVLDSYFRGERPSAYGVSKYITNMNHSTIKKAMDSLKKKGIIE